MCYITNNKENELSLQKLKIFAYEKDYFTLHDMFIISVFWK